MAHAERTRFPAPADSLIASLDVADIRRDLAVRPRRASVRLRTSGIQSAGIGNARSMRQDDCELAFDRREGSDFEWMGIK